MLWFLKAKETCIETQLNAFLGKKPELQIKTRRISLGENVCLLTTCVLAQPRCIIPKWAIYTEIIQSISAN